MGFVDTFRNAAMVHALAVHGPIALAFLGVPLVFLSAILKEKGASIRWLAIAAYAALTLAAFVTVQTGEHARDALPNQSGIIAEPVWQLVHDHEEMAQKIWLFALATTILTSFTFAQGPRMRAAGGALAVLAALATAGWVGLTGHYGGMLVYVHGLGTPALEYKQRSMGHETGPPAAVPGAPVPDGSAQAIPEVPPVVPPPAPLVETEIPVAQKPAVREVSYMGDVVPMFRENCYGCHGKASGLNLQTVATMLVGGKKEGRSVLAGRPTDSPLIKYVTGVLQPRMPKDGDPLADEQIAILEAWVAQGMPDDSPE
jgi:mono/diheme cytochrome c family protein